MGNIVQVNPFSIDPNITKDPSGFLNPGSVIINYNSTNRTITLTGDTTAYWRGSPISALVSGWVSAAHTATTGLWFLYYDDTGFNWSQTIWSFDKVQIASVSYGATDKFGIRESHGLMPWQTHEELHQVIGTYRESGGDLSAYVLASTTAANRRPDVSACLVNDEDLDTTNPALTSKSYTQFYLSGATADPVFVTAQADICRLSTNQPYYNLYTGGAWTQALVSNGNYMCIWLVEIPVTSDAGSQTYRHVWMQGQSQGALAAQQALSPVDVVTGSLRAITTEMVFIQKTIIRYNSNNWTWIQTDVLSGSKFLQVGSPAGTYLSSVSTDTTLSGDGTVTNPLSVVIPSVSQSEIWAKAIR